MFLNQVHAWFLEITFSAQCASVCMCVYAAQFWLYMIGGIIAAAFQFRFMTLAVDVTDRRGPSNKMHRQLKPKKTKVRLY